MGLTAAVVGGTALLGTGAQMYSASEAASQQKDAAKSSNALMKSMYDTTRSDLAPYRDLGINFGNKLLDMQPGLTKGFSPTMEQLEQTPGYKFTLDQGIKSLFNSNSGKWGSGSGPMGKALAGFTTGLASQTYQQQFQNYWDQNRSIYNMLLGPTSLGAQAAGQQVGANQNYAAGVGSNMIGAGNAGAAAAIGMGSAVSQAPMNALMEYRLLDQTMNPSKYGVWGMGGPGTGGYGTPGGFGTQYMIGDGRPM